MEIRRAISYSASWTLALRHVPALLALIDEQQIPVDIQLTQGAGKVSLRAGTVYCRRCASRLILEASGTSIQIDLDRLGNARVVSRAAGSRRRMSLELVGESGTAWLAITGPAPRDGLEGQVWQTVMDSLLAENAMALGRETWVHPVLAVPDSDEGARLPGATARLGWASVLAGTGLARTRLAIGAQS